MKNRDTRYIKIWKDAHGPIPKDEDGRTYEIHHIDGDATNNHLNNLMCVSIKEHYKIHLKQGDLLAARYIAMRMDVDLEITRSLISQAQQKRVEDGTHNWLAENGNSEICYNRQMVRVKNHTHQFITKEYEEYRLEQYHLSVEERKSNGTYHMLVDNPTYKMLENCTHNFLGPNQNKKMLEKGIHPSQIKKECPYCGKIVDSANYGRYHGERCKAKPVHE